MFLFNQTAELMTVCGAVVVMAAAVLLAELLPATNEAKAAAAAADDPPIVLVAVMETLLLSKSGAGDSECVDEGEEQSLCKLKAGEAEAA